MKLKLKITKHLKRQLKINASKMDQERTNYVLELLKQHITDNSSVWTSKVETYPQLLIDRKEGLEVLKASFTEDMPIEEQRAQLKEYYVTHHMYVNYYNKNKKYENLILTLEDNDYYALCLIGESKQESVEKYVADFLTHKQ